MSSNLGETAKKLILVCWEKARQPPPRMAPGFGDSHTWRNAKLIHQNAKTGSQNETPEWGGGNSATFQITQQ